MELPNSVKVGFYVGITVLAIIGGIHTYREQDRINHRLDVRDTYFKKGLIDGAKQREDALNEHRRFAERVLNHCAARPDGCGLPNELTVLPTKPDLDPLETLLTSNKE